MAIVKFGGCIRIGPMFRFAAELLPGYSVSAQDDASGSWTVVITGEGREPLSFSNLDGGIEEVLRSAETFARDVLHSWSVPFSGPLNWRYVKR
jgi:hypothetical protein